MINLQKEHLVIVQKILRQHIPAYEVWLFGSRATNKIKPHSDLDLVIMANKPLSPETFVALQEAFEDSDLPFRTDIVQWCKLSQDFKDIILQNYSVIQAPRG
jgi:predicted nucleotidyltransferase